MPARQGMHLPHDSSMQNSMKNLATSTMFVSWSMTIMPPEPMIEPTLDERFVVDRRIEVLGRDAAAGRPAGLHRLDRARRAAPPPISSTIWRSVVPIGTSTSPVLRILPARAKTLVPLLFSVPIDGEPVAAVADDGRDVGEGLDVVDQSGKVPEAGVGRVGRPRPREAALALDRVDQRRLLAADIRPGADADVDPEVERRLEDLAAQQAEAAWPA